MGNTNNVYNVNNINNVINVNNYNNNNNNKNNNNHFNNYHNNYLNNYCNHNCKHSNNDACRLRCGNDPVCSHWGFRADQNRCVLKTSDGGRRQNINVDSGQRPCSTTTTTTTTPQPPLSCHECDQFVGCSSPDDVGNVTTCPETTSHCMVSVNEGTGKVFRRCGEAAETAEQCESSITLAGNIVKTCFCRESLCNSENEPTTTTTTTTTTSPPLVLVPNGNEIIDSL